MKLLKTIIVALIFQGNFLQSQDFHLSLYDASPLFLNPAMTGVVNAKMRFHAQYRNQWNSIAYKPFTTALISFDAPVGKWGYGAQVMNMRAGVGNYNAFQFLGSAGYSLPIDKNKYNNLSFGLQAGFTQKSVNTSLYSFDEQYDSENGTFNNNMSSNENFRNMSQTLPQVNAGAMYYYVKQQSLLNPFLGVSGFNLTRPRETFFDQNNRLPLRVNMHTGVRINITEGIYLVPKVLIMSQGKAFEQTYALDAGYFLSPAELCITAGYIFRVNDASIASLGARKENYIFKIAYDFNTSGLKSVTNYKGAWELSFTYLIGREKTPNVKHCPKL